MRIRDLLYAVFIGLVGKLFGGSDTVMFAVGVAVFAVLELDRKLRAPTASSSAP